MSVLGESLELRMFLCFVIFVSVGKLTRGIFYFSLYIVLVNSTSSFFIFSLNNSLVLLVIILMI